MTAKQRLLFAAAIMPISLWLATGGAGAQGLTPESAKTIDPIKHQVVDYRWLRGTGDVQYYRIEVNKTGSLRLQISIPNSTASQFKPQVAWFEPSLDTIGPGLPIVQPPNTMALIYPGGHPKPVFDIFSQASYSMIIDIQPEIKTAGIYYLAVYNFGRGDGRYRLLIDQYSPIAQWADAWILPIRWWRDQMFAGFSWQTTITPILIGLLAWWLWIRLEHHKLYPARKNTQKNKTKQ